MYSYESLDIKKALLLGVVQGIALLPGISRFALTYVVGRFLKLSPRRSFETSFLIQFPLIIAGFCKGLFYLLLAPNCVSIFGIQVIWAFLGGTVVSFGFLHFVYYLALRGKLWLFSFYMLIPIILGAIQLIMR